MEKICSPGLYDYNLNTNLNRNEWDVIPTTISEFMSLRTSFNAPCATCCRLSYDENRSADNCFVGNDTCAPECRYGSGAGCQQLFIDQCVNIEPPNTYERVWFNEQTQLCKRLARQNLYTPSGEPDLRNTRFIQQHMATIFSNAFPDGFSNTPSSLQTSFTQFCKDNPNACSLALTQQCSRYSTEELSLNPNIASLCGCYLQPSNYARLLNFFGVQRECQPICNTNFPVQYTDPQTLQPRQCTSSLCFINDITLNLINSTTGNINFSQVCSSCGPNANCTCSINNVRITAVEASLRNINLSQECGGVINCFGQNPDNPDGPAIPINCETLEPDDPDSGGFTGILLYSILGSIILILLIIYIIFAVRK